MATTSKIHYLPMTTTMDTKTTTSNASLTENRSKTHTLLSTTTTMEIVATIAKDRVLIRDENLDASENQEQMSKKTKQIVGGVVGGSLGALTVGLLGGLLGAMTPTTTTEMLSTIKSTSTATATTTTTLIKVTTTTVTRAVANLGIVDQPPTEADISSPKSSNFPWWWVVPAILVPLCLAGLFFLWKHFGKRTKGSAKANKQSRKMSSASSPASPSSPSSPMLGLKPGTDNLSPMKLPAFPMTGQSARTLGVSPEANDGALNAESTDNSFVLPASSGPDPALGMPPMGPNAGFAQASAQQAHAQQAQAWAQAQAMAAKGKGKGKGKGPMVAMPMQPRFF